MQNKITMPIQLFTRILSEENKLDNLPIDKWKQFLYCQFHKKDGEEYVNLLKSARLFETKKSLYSMVRKLPESALVNAG